MGELVHIIIRSQWLNCTRSSAVAKRPRDASCLYSFYTLEWCGYRMVNKFEHMFIRFDMIHEREKIAVFTYHSPHFCFPWGRPWSNHAKCCMDGKWIRCLQIVLQHVPIYLQQFPRYSNRNAKNRHFHVPQPTFLFPLRTPLGQSC